MLNYNRKLKERSQKLRRNMTAQERHLWFDFLRSYSVSFHRQMVINNYIADFYCPKAKLVIEIDGSEHYQEKGRENDKIRTAVLEGMGLHVLRFSNREVDRNFEGVCYKIDEMVKLLLETHPPQAVSYVHRT